MQKPKLDQVHSICLYLFTETLKIPLLERIEEKRKKDPGLLM